MRALILILILSLAASPTMGQTLAETMTQTWLGEAEQEGAENFGVILHLHGDGAVIDFPTLDCAGWWEFTATDADSITGVEHLVAGQDLCIDEVPFRVVSDGALGINVTWFDKDGSPIAVAAMSRL